MCLVMKAKTPWLWRAVDQDSYELDVLLQSHKTAAKRFFRKPLKGLLYVPRVIITDKYNTTQRPDASPMLGKSAKVTRKSTIN